MNISEVISAIKDKNGAANIFRNGLIYNMKRVDSRTAAVFYHNIYTSRDIYHYTNDEMNCFREFSVQYTCVTFLVKKFSKTVEQKYIEKYCVPFVKAHELPTDQDVIELIFDESSGTYRMQYT